MYIYIYAFKMFGTSTHSNSTAGDLAKVNEKWRLARGSMTSILQLTEIPPLQTSQDETDRSEQMRKVPMVDECVICWALQDGEDETTRVPLPTWVSNPVERKILEWTSEQAKWNAEDWSAGGFRAGIASGQQGKVWGVLQNQKHVQPALFKETRAFGATCAKPRGLEEAQTWFGVFGIAIGGKSRKSSRQDWDWSIQAIGSPQRSAYWGGYASCSSCRWWCCWRFGREIYRQGRRRFRKRGRCRNWWKGAGRERNGAHGRPNGQRRSPGTEWWWGRSRGVWVGDAQIYSSEEFLSPGGVPQVRCARLSISSPRLHDFIP